MIVNGLLMSETSFARGRLMPYCQGIGLDIGFGGDPIVPWAICLDRSEGSRGRASFKGFNFPTHLPANADALPWFKDGVLDFVYSSHCLEDFKDTVKVCQEWLRVIKPGGNLIIFCPNQQTYLNHCRVDGALPNQDHAHDDFGIVFLKKAIFSLGYSQADVIHEIPMIDTYSFDLVIQKK